MPGPPNISDQLADKITHRSVDILRFDAHIQRRIAGLMEQMELELVHDLEELDPTEPKRQRYKRTRIKALQKQAKETITDYHRGARQVTEGELLGLTRVEEEYARSLINGVLGADVATVVVAPDLLRGIVMTEAVEGAPSAVWWKKTGTNLSQKFDTQIQLGMSRGESLQDITRRIRGKHTGKYTTITLKSGKKKRVGIFAGGILDTNTRETQALIRTSVQHVANRAREEVYVANDDVVKGKEWLSTLDMRTTVTCQVLDGKTWDLENKPIGHKIKYPGPTAHWGCRSTQMPVLKSWEELAEEDLTEKPKFREIPLSTRASMDGQKSAGINYETWLRGKDQGIQEEILGIKKRKLWLEGKVNFSQLVDQSGNPRTLGQLAGITPPPRIPTKKLKALESSITENYGEDWPKSVARDFDTAARASDYPDLTSRLTWPEKFAIRHYTSPAFAEINAAARYPRELPGRFRRNKSVISAIDSGLKEMPVFRGTVYRQAIDMPDEVLQGLSPGSVFSDKGFLSTSKQQTKRHNFRFEIRSSTGRDISDISNIGVEQEVLFARNARFRVVSSQKTNGITNIVMDEI